MAGHIPTQTPQPPATPPPRTPTAPGRETREAQIPIGAQVGDVFTIDGRTFVVAEVFAGAVVPSPGGGGTQRARLIEVLPNETAQSALASVAQGASPTSGGGQGPVGPLAPGGPRVPESTTVAPGVTLPGLGPFTGGQAGDDGDELEGLGLQELLRLCTQEGNLAACVAVQTINAAQPGGLGGAGLSFEDEIALQRLRGQQALEQIRQQLFPSLEQIGRQEAQDVTEGITTGLASSLAAIGLAAPQIFLSNAQDPVGLQRALASALGSGNAVFPTIERQQLIAEAAQSPTDIIRLLFLSGGQTPPTRRPGAFNVVGVLEEGRRAREGLAQEIAGLPLPTFEELVDRFTPPLPPIGAAKGAVITMKKQKNGSYRAAEGATIVEGPELFTVGEGGKTEFALLAPGSVIAPKLSDDEPETVDSARRAIMEMLIFGRRRPKAAVHGAVVPFDEPLIPTIGGPTPESGQGLQTLLNLIEGVRGAGAALADPGRSTSERARDLRLLAFPFEGVDLEDRLSVLEQFQDDPNIARFFDIGLTPRARDPLPFAGEEFARQERILLGQAEQQLRDEGVNLDAMEEQQRNMAIRQRAAQNNPEIFGSAEGALQTIEEQQRLGLEASLGEGGGAPGTQLPFAEILAMPAGARSAFITVLGSIFGSDVIADLLDLRSQTRSQGFRAAESRLFI